MIWRIALTLLAGYLLGNFNGAIIISQHLYHDDVRTHGSGNAGMTNFMRTYGKKKLLPVILIDLGKAALACMIGLLLLKPLGLGAEGKMLGGMGCLAGHAFPVFYGFRGGKGVLSACAIAACMHWWTLLIALALFFIILFSTHYMSLASMTGVTAWCIMAQFVFWKQWLIMICTAIIAVAVIWLHRGNIRRLCQGTETKTYLRQPK